MSFLIFNITKNVGRIPSYLTRFIFLDFNDYYTIQKYFLKITFEYSKILSNIFVIKIDEHPFKY